MADPFLEGILDVQEDLNKRWSAECARLRKENAALRKELAERDPDLWALSEELQAMQMRLDAASSLLSKEK